MAATYIGGMPTLLLLFIAVSAAATGFDIYLRARQSAYVARHRGAVPAAFAASVTLEEHQRAADYERARLRLGTAAAVFGLIVAVGWATFGYDALYGWVAGKVQPGITRGVGFLVTAAAISSLLGLPFALLRTFGVEARFGFNRTTPARFVLDRLKGWAVSLVIGVPLLAGLLWVMRQPGPWWAWAWLGLMVLMLAMMDLYPRVIAPLFNRFTPLDGPLRVRVEALLERCGFQSGGLFVMDASRRSAHGNAYFSGLGRSKRIVLFDTLIASNPRGGTGGRAGARAGALQAEPHPAGLAANGRCDPGRAVLRGLAAEAAVAAAVIRDHPSG